MLTLAELHLGVLMAKSPKIMAQRLKTLGMVEGSFEPLPIDDAVARIFAEIVAGARRRDMRPKVVDVLIAAAF